MAYCPKCGIQIERDKIPCPLCFTYIPEVLSDEQLLKENGFPHYYSMYENVRDNILKLIFRIFNIVAFLAILIPSLVNFVLSKALTWSLYSTVSIMFSWIVLYIFFKKNNRRILTLGVTIFFLLLALDMVNSPINWSVIIAIPTLLISYILISLNKMFFVTTKRNWLAFLGLITISIYVLTIWIDFIVGQYINREDVLSWSLNNTTGFLSIGISFILLAYTIPKRWKDIIKRKFHF